jgi:Raf kinase inhibitor-like YbhB/YbcL family protein
MSAVQASRRRRGDAGVEGATAARAGWISLGLSLMTLTACGPGLKSPVGASPMDVTSPAFASGERIPVRHTGDGENLSPPLAWSAVPAGTKSFALIVDDPDAPTREPWVHWVLFNIPPKTTRLREGVPASGLTADLAGARQGVTNFGTKGYGGPAPPPGHGTHHYHFKLYALDAVLDLPDGSTKAQVLAALKGHVLGEGDLVGTYSR